MYQYQIQLSLPKFLDDHYGTFFLTLTIVLLGLWAAIDYAEGAYYCGKTCQALRDTEKAKEVKKPEPCYGIYCPKTNTTIQDNKVIKPGSKEDIIYNLSQKNFISLRVSNACKKMDTYHCPSVKELADAFDNSNKYLSGDFYFDNKSTTWKRTPPKIPNVFELYKFIDNMPWFLWVDPDDYTWDRSKQIIIEPSLRYIKRSDDIGEDRVRYEYEGLSLKHCASAVIGWENNGKEILLDVLNHFYSNCREQVEYDPTVEIFLGTKVFENCDQRCLYLKDRFKMEIKSEALAYKNDKKDVVPPKSSDKPCYGIYCKEEKQTTEETITSLQEKEKIRKERLKELEDIAKCEKYKRYDSAAGRVDIKVDCKNKTERDKYLLPIEKEQLEKDKEQLEKDIQKCEELKQVDKTARKVNCNDDVERKAYLEASTN